MARILVHGCGQVSSDSVLQSTISGSATNGFLRNARLRRSD